MPYDTACSQLCLCHAQYHSCLWEHYENPKKIVEEQRREINKGGRVENRRQKAPEKGRALEKEESAGEVRGDARHGGRGRPPGRLAPPKFRCSLSTTVVWTLWVRRSQGNIRQALWEANVCSIFNLNVMVVMDAVRRRCWAGNGAIRRRGGTSNAVPCKVQLRLWLSPKAPQINGWLHEAITMAFPHHFVVKVI